MWTGTPVRDRWYVRMVRRYIGVGPYLDFGCGTGHLLRRLAAHGSASGFEVSERSAGLPRVTAPGCPVHTTLDDIPSGVFRAITAIGVLHHLDDAAVASVLACWRRVLVPGGRVIVVVQISGTSHARWRRLLADAGFTVRREGGDGAHTVPSMIQLWSGRLFLKPGRGGSSVFVIEARRGIIRS